MAEVQESKAPLTQPNRPALAKVNKKAGSGAARDWKTIRRKEMIWLKSQKRVYTFMVSHLAG